MDEELKSNLEIIPPVIDNDETVIKPKTVKNEVAMDELFEENLLVDFADLIPGQKYYFVMIRAKKQLRTQFDKSLAKAVSAKRKKWYVPMVGYFERDCEFKSYAHDKKGIPYKIPKHVKVTINFSGYGFFYNLKHCRDKILKGQRAADGMRLILERYAMKSTTTAKFRLTPKWSLHSVHRVKEINLIDPAKKWEVIYRWR
jgi:hypothetical protein